MPDPLAQLERLLAVATPRPWKAERGWFMDGADKTVGTYFEDALGKTDAALIVALVNAAPHLIADYRRMCEALERITDTAGELRRPRREQRLPHEIARDALAGLRAHLGETT